MTPEQIEELVSKLYDEERVRPLVDDYLHFDEGWGRWHAHPGIVLGVALGYELDDIWEEITKGERSAAVYAIADLANITYAALDYFYDGYDLKPCRLDNPEFAPYYLAGFRVRAKYAPHKEMR